METEAPKRSAGCAGPHKMQQIYSLELGSLAPSKHSYYVNASKRAGLADAVSRTEFYSDEPS